MKRDDGFTKLFLHGQHDLVAQLRFIAMYGGGGEGCLAVPRAAVTAAEGRGDLGGKLVSSVGRRVVNLVWPRLVTCIVTACASLSSLVRPWQREVAKEIRLPLWMNPRGAGTRKAETPASRRRYTPAPV